MSAKLIISKICGIGSGALYEILLGQSQGPRMGSFIALYGVAETVALIDRALNGEDLAA